MLTAKPFQMVLLCLFVLVLGPNCFAFDTPQKEQDDRYYPVVTLPVFIEFPSHKYCAEGDEYCALSEFDKAIKAYSLALAKYKTEIHSTPKWAYLYAICLAKRAVAHCYNKEMHQARRDIKECFRVCKESSLHNNFFWVKATIDKEFGDYKAAANCLEEAGATSEPLLANWCLRESLINAYGMLLKAGDSNRDKKFLEHLRQVNKAKDPNRDWLDSKTTVSPYLTWYSVSPVSEPEALDIFRTSLKDQLPAVKTEDELTFSSALWKSAIVCDTEIRKRMLRNLIFNNHLYGRSKKSVRELLGRPSILFGHAGDFDIYPLCMSWRDSLGLTDHAYPPAYDTSSTVHCLVLGYSTKGKAVYMAVGRASGLKLKPTKI